MIGEEQISGALVTVGMLVLVGILVGSTYRGISQINVPSDSRQSVSGERSETINKISDLADRCWEKSSGGTSEQVKDCFLVEVNSTEERIEESEVRGELQQLSPNRFRMEPLRPEDKGSIKVSFRPQNGTVEVTRFKYCDRSTDTCRDSNCRCVTTCRPDLDIDGDGEPETDGLGCIEPRYYENLGDGDDCSYDFQCRGDL